MMHAIEAFYAAAERAGMLTTLVVEGQSVQVDFRAPDQTVLDGLALSTDYTLRYPLAWLPALAPGQCVTVAGQAFQVREVRAIGDGSERQATLTRC